ncbi:MAG: mannose-1-phosphate guanylyltransferase [Verrucomicrobia bacterium]|nr:mannose-1-phosphate guanylyltransferase [Verrucomicrobiota bacterium]
MRHAMIMAGGSGTRLWPMSREALPKQLIPFIGGKSLLQIAAERLDGLVPPAQRFVCAANKHRAVIQQSLPAFGGDRFFGEPCGRDTLNAVGFSAAVIARRDPDAVIAVFTADHIIEPVDEFQRIVASGYEIAEKFPNALVTFGIAPTGPATGYGYLQLGAALVGPVPNRAQQAASAASGTRPTARIVEQFKEKPDAATAQGYFAAGPARYLWNSGMFIWRADTLLDCIRRYSPENHASLMRIAGAWDTPQRDAVVAEVYPMLKKISVDFAVMEPASRDPKVRVAAVPMPLKWLDVGSWPFFAQTCTHDADGNAIAARNLLRRTKNTLVASNDPKHLIATIGCEDLIIIHTPDATLVCRADQAEAIKEMQKLVGERFGSEYL